MIVKLENDLHHFGMLCLKIYKNSSLKVILKVLSLCLSLCSSTSPQLLRSQKRGWKTCVQTCTTRTHLMFAITAPRVCEPHGQCVMAAPSPPRLSAAWRVEAPFFICGVTLWWFFRIAVYLCRCMALHDPVPYRESVHVSCGRPFEITSCFFHTAQRLGKC